MYINNIFIVYDKGWDWVVYLKSVENDITLGKLIGLLFLFCLPLLSILFLKTKRNDLARPVMGTIFLVLWFVYHLKWEGKYNRTKRFIHYLKKFRYLHL